MPSDGASGALCASRFFRSTKRQKRRARSSTSRKKTKPKLHTCLHLEVAERFSPSPRPETAPGSARKSTAEAVPGGLGGGLGALQLQRVGRPPALARHFHALHKKLLFNFEK